MRLGEVCVKDKSRQPIKPSSHRFDGLTGRILLSHSAFLIEQATLKSNRPYC